MWCAVGSNIGYVRLCLRRGHKMDVGKYKMSSEDVTAILKEVGSLEVSQ